MPAPMPLEYMDTFSIASSNKHSTSEISSMITLGIREKIIQKIFSEVKYLAYLLFKTLILMIWNIEQNVSHSSVLVCWCWLFILGKGTRPHHPSQPGKAIVRNNDDVCWCDVDIIIRCICNPFLLQLYFSDVLIKNLVINIWNSLRFFTVIQYIL